MEDGRGKFSLVSGMGWECSLIKFGHCLMVEVGSWGIGNSGVITP